MGYDQEIEAAIARKHRIAMRNRQRSSSSSSSSSSFADNVEIITNKSPSKRSRNEIEEDRPIIVSCSASNYDKVITEDVQSTKKKPHITGIKLQSRYDPGVSMTKEELKTWRKEARRVRNRESAAASRKKNRESIQELETKIKIMKDKYTDALRYILELEEGEQQRNTLAGYPDSFSIALRNDLEDIRESSLLDTVSLSRPCSPSPACIGMDTVQNVSTPISPSSTDPTPFQVEREVQQQQSQDIHQKRLSRHSKVKVSNNEHKNTTNHPLPDHDHHLNHHHTSSNYSQKQHIIDTMIIRPIACV